MLFSVIVPIYNKEKYLRKCIESILNQTYTDFELILVNDGSIDNSNKICDSYKNNDSRVKVIHTENHGASRARYTGIKNSNGKYILFVDADDWIKDNLLERCNNVINKYANIDIVAYGMNVYYKNKITFHNYNNNMQGYFSREKLKKYLLPELFLIGDNEKNAVCYTSIFTKIFKKNFLIKHYCKDYSIKIGEDFCLSYECLYNAESIYFIDEAYYVYNYCSGNSITGHKFSPLEPNVYKYVKSKFSNKVQYIKDQIDYLYIKEVEKIYDLYKDQKKSNFYIISKLKPYEILDEIKPPVKSNNLMTKRQKKFLAYMYKKQSWRIVYNIHNLYKFIDFNLWRLRCKLFKKKEIS